MAALDDRYDVFDYCQKHGLDYDSLSDQQKARDAMYAQFHVEYTPEQKAEQRKTRDEWSAIRGNMVKLMKARYGGYER